MTVLENQRRRNQRSQFKKGPAVLRRPWRARYRRRTPQERAYYSNNRSSNNNSNNNSSSSKNNNINNMPDFPKLDSLTVMAVKAEVDSLLLQGNGSCTVLELANAIVASPHVLRSFAEQQDDNEDGSNRNGSGATVMNLLGRFLTSLKLGDASSSSSTLSSRRDKAMVQRRYTLIKAMHQLETRTSSVAVAGTRRITSWKQAVEELLTVLTFPPQVLEPPTATTKSASSSSSSSLSLQDYQKRVLAVRRETLLDELQKSHRMLQQVATADTLPSIQVDALQGLDAADQALAIELSNELQARDERLKSTAVAKMEARLQQEQRDQEAEKLASSLMQQLSDEDQERVFEALNDHGAPTEVIVQVGPDSIQRESIQRLLPGQWLNDEVIHYFYVVLSKRDEELCRAQPTRQRSHFFKSFFMTKLLNEGNANPALEGKYEYRNVKRWSKKVPGKDIFNLDKIIFPINQGSMHWVCAVIYMQQKRIQFYDSMGDSGRLYLGALFQYIKDEHQDKKGVPLGHQDQWELITCTRDTPRQLNGFDCGVFTCMFADFLSKDCPLVFGQSHVTQCRERIALSILNGQAVM